MKKGVIKYYVGFFLLAFNSFFACAQDLNPSLSSHTIISKYNNYEGINYTFERNQFKLQYDEKLNSEHQTDELFKSLKFTSLFNKQSKPLFMNQNNEDLYFAWKLTNYLSVSLNVFENPLSFTDYQSQNSSISPLSFNKSISPISPITINRSVSGYKFGVSSELGLGNNYKLGLNLDIGQLDDADLIGFNQKEINTTSFALGIRKSQFGASINTDLFLEDMETNLEQSRLGFELDWHFSEDGKLSFGSKKTLGDSHTNSMNSIDDITGNVQYIKFQHNL